MRRGKLRGRTKVVIPYFTDSGDRQYHMLTIDGTLYASKLYSGIRKFVKDNFGIKVNTDWLHNVPLIANEYDPEFVRTEEETNRMIEQLIDSWELKDDEIENLTDSGSKTEDAPHTGE